MTTSDAERFANAPAVPMSRKGARELVDMLLDIDDKSEPNEVLSMLIDALDEAQGHVGEDPEKRADVLLVITGGEI